MIGWAIFYFVTAILLLLFLLVIHFLFNKKLFDSLEVGDYILDKTGMYPQTYKIIEIKLTKKNRKIFVLENIYKEVNEIKFFEFATCYRFFYCKNPKIRF